MPSTRKKLRSKKVAKANEELEALAEEVEDNAPSPFAIPELVNHLLKFLPLNGLKNCRLVNRLWNEASLRLIPQKQQQGIVLGWFGRVEPNRCGMENVPEFIAMVNSSAHFPITKFTLEGECVESDAGRKLAMDFLKAVAPFATEIFIDNYIRERIYSEELIQFPALKALKICYAIKHKSGNKSDGDHSSKDYDWEEDGGRFDQEIVENAPNLQKLEFERHGSDYTSDALDLLETDNGRRITRASSTNDVTLKNRFSKLFS